MYEYDLNEILFMNECHNLSGFIEGLETAKRLLDIHDTNKTKEILQKIIDITWGRKYIICKSKYGFLREDQEPAEASPQPAYPSESTQKKTD